MTSRRLRSKNDYTQRARRRVNDRPLQPNTDAITIRGAVEGLSLVIAPATLLTALAYWFGWTFTNTRAAYFGIDHSALGFSTSDYVLRSAEAAFVPLDALLVILLAAITVHRIVRQLVRRPEPHHILRPLAIVMIVAGVILSSAGLYALFWPLPWPTFYLLPPMALGVGVVILAYGVWIVRVIASRSGNAEPNSIWERLAWLIVLMLALLSLFWTSSLYAAALGRGRAQGLERTLADRPGVVIFSKQSLAIEGPGVAATRVAEPESVYHFRYSGLRLLIRSSDRYFLVPTGWSRRTGTVVVLDEAADIRVEFQPGG